MREMISSSNNPVIKLARTIRGRKSRQGSDLFIVEGVHHVGEVVEANWDIDQVIYAPELLTSSFGKNLISERIKSGQRCTAVTSVLFHTIADKENPQGILALVHRKEFPLDLLARSEIRLGVALVSPQDPGNVGAILRTLDAVDGDVLFLLDGGVDPYHPACIRSSMGTIFWKPIVQSTFPEFVAWAREGGFRLIGSSSHARIDYKEIPGDERRKILILGSEQKGLSKEQIEACDQTVSMPMKGRVSSLNLAVAAGILLYELTKK